MILLPLLGLLAWALAFKRGGRDWLDAAAAALLVFGLGVSVATELQSLTGTLTPAGSAIAWTIVAALGFVAARRARAAAALGTDEAPAVRIQYLIYLLPVVLFLALTAIVALVSAPNSFDGLTYHLVRVERWVQQGSLRPFATHDTRQLFMPSWPEYAILQLRLLSGGDRFANLAQWIGFAGICGGAALLARALGGGRMAGALAAALVATLPMAIAQASGTQTDVLAACWAVLACGFGYRLLADAPRRGDALLSALALGLAAATKQTALLFGAVALLPAVALLLRRGSRRLWVSCLAAVLLAIGVIAGPQLARNRAVFGDVRGDPALIGSVVMGTRGPNQVIGNLLRNLSVHFGTPWDAVNRSVVEAVATISRAIGADPEDPRTTWDAHFVIMPWNTHEEEAPNPIHLLLVLGCLVALLRGKSIRVRLLFITAVVGGFIVFCAQLKWQSYGSRLHTPLFVLALSWVAVELERLPAALRGGLLTLLALAALPNALLNYTRPLLALPGGAITPRPSILTIPRNLGYFLYMPQLARGYREVALRIADRECDDVGIRDWADSWEYPVMALARNAGSAAKFRSLDVTNASARFARDAGPPCLLLQIGPDAGRLPAWAADWRPLADWHTPLGIRGIALFAPTR
jgi:hypothetical protein